MQTQHNNASASNSQWDNYASFLDYINKTKPLLQLAHPDRYQDNMPEIFKPTPTDLHRKPAKYENGALLVHGLFASPFQMRDMAEKLRDKGFFVQTLLLPGHGTQPEDLKNISYHDWLDCVAFGIDELAKKAKNISLIGFSLGGLLSLYHALDNPLVDKVALLAPALKIKPYVSFVIHLSKWSNRLFNFPKWFLNRPQASHTLYTAHCFNAALQIQQLCKQLQKKLKKNALRKPCFMSISLDDESICTKTALDFFKNKVLNGKTGIVYGKKNNITDPNLEFRQSAYPAKNILDFSHTCLPIAPENWHLGEKGDFKDFIRYKNNEPPLNKKEAMGASSPKNLLNYAVQRLSFNPDFHPMIEKLGDFLKKS